MYEADKELRGGELSPSACPGGRNRPPGKRKIANSKGGWGGGHGNRLR